MLVISQSVLSLLSPIIHYSKEFRKAERTQLEKEKAMNTQKNRSHTLNFCFFNHRRPVKNETTATTTTAPKIDGTNAIPAKCGPQCPNIACPI